MLFVCAFPDLTPLLVDAESEEDARAIATETAGGEVAPSRVVAIPPRVFVAELFAEDDDGSETIVDPLDHTVDFLEQVDAALDDACAALETCDEDADHDGEIVTCALPLGHAEAEHEAVTADGRIVHW